MGRIDEVVAGSDGEIKEAIVVLHPRQKTRRPVNLLTPFEIGDEPPLTEKQVSEDQNKSEDERIPKSKYDLRPRKKVNYNGESRIIQHVRLTPLFMSALMSIVFVCGYSKAHETYGSFASTGHRSLR
ncbi:hypothetical protein ANCDUO_08524 [Ancylostoma duodenale]|uniref:Uncharacterized protein n=1 Tax=Ancylostoma duodenale TaxID=51022 RepID=A0A0C2GJ27_9BILA|nr:hypothetical protein ANCDUO_08524 [Ancylostoma duodenale]